MSLFRTISIGAACAALLVVTGEAAAVPTAKMTHKVTISATFVNHWTIQDPQECNPVGDGTVTLKFHTTTATRVKPYKDDYAGGGWNVDIPYGRNLRGMKYVKAKGTLTRVDNTTPRPSSDPTNPCPPLVKGGCGVFPTKAKAYLDGEHNPRRITLHTSTNLGTEGGCLFGDTESFDATRALVGGNSEGKVRLKMPKPSKLRRKRVVVKGKTHKQSSWGDPGDTQTTNDITRRVTVRFKRL